MKYFVLGDEDAVLGFGMVGVKGRVVRKEEDARNAFQEVLENTNVGIIIMTERVADLVREQVDAYMFTHQFPLIVEIPDHRGKIEGKPGIREMVNNAIGIRI